MWLDDLDVEDEEYLSLDLPCYDKRIEQDRKHFKDIISGKRQQELKKRVRDGGFVTLRPDGRGKLHVPVPVIDIPHIVHGPSDKGIGAGPGKVGDIVKKGKKKGKGGPQPGEEAGEGMLVDVELDEILKELGEDLGLPNLKPKETQTLEDEYIKYNGISKFGPRSLLHPRRTLKETVKRQAGKPEMKLLPGATRPVPVFYPIKDDFRFRQWNIIKKPNSNAAIFFLRDGSGSMGEEKCDIVSDISFWIDLWIRKHYQQTKKFYIWHDTEAKVLSEKDFYRLRWGGGTFAVSSLKLMKQMLQYQCPPERWNIYLFYFGDGETFGRDNTEFVRMLQTELGPDVVNLAGITQIMSYRYQGSLKYAVDKALKDKQLKEQYVKTVSVGSNEDKDNPNSYTLPSMSQEERNMAVKHAIRVLLGGKSQEAK